MVEFEHTLFMLLLLLGLLNARPRNPSLTLGAVALGILLAFLPPPATFRVPWELVIGLSVPVLLWQNGRRWATADWRGGTRELVLWTGVLLLFTVIFRYPGNLTWEGAILFAVIASSLLWRAGEPEGRSSYVSQIGPLAIVFLLVEVAPTVETPGHYIEGAIGGAAVGLAVALSAYAAARRTAPDRRSLIALPMAYLAYWVAPLLRTSSIASAVVAVVVYVALGTEGELLERRDLKPAPLNSWVGFGVVLVVFLLLGWESHQPVELGVLLPVALGVILGLAAVALGQAWGLPSFEELRSLWRAGARTAVLLFPAFLLWPRGILEQPVQLAIALGLAAVLLVVSTRMLGTYVPSGREP